MDSRDGRPSMIEGVTLGLVATGAVSIGVGAIMGQSARGSRSSARQYRSLCPSRARR